MKKKKRKRYVYLVHRMSSDKYSYPVLGAHSNVEKAQEHFSSIKSDRLSRQSFCHYDNKWCGKDPYRESTDWKIREAFFEHQDKNTETLMLTRFQIN
jgi:hypothetical protein